LPALTGNRLAYRDGVLISVLSGGKVQFFVTLETALEWEAQSRLLRSAAPHADGRPSGSYQLN